MAKPYTTEEIGSLRLDPDIVSGFLGYHENPDPVLRDNANGLGIAFYDDVDRDDRAGAVLDARYDAVAGERWEIVPASKSARDKKIAEFITKVFKSTNFQTANKDALQAILYGYYGLEFMFTEVNWKGFGGRKIAIDVIRGKHPRRLLFDVDRNIRIRTRLNSWNGEDVPDKKFVVYTYNDTDNPYGKGLGRRLWWPVWFKKNGIAFWAKFLEKFGQPTVVAHYKDGETETDKIDEAIRFVKSQTSILVPEGTAISLLEASRNGSPTFLEMCDRMDKAITITVRHNNLTTDVSGGSRSAAETHDGVEHRITEMDASDLEAVYNEGPIRWLVDWNYTGVTEYPLLRIITEKEEVQKEEAETYKILKEGLGLNLDPVFVADKFNVKTDGPPEFKSDVESPPPEEDELPEGDTERAGDFAEAEIFGGPS